ncbi:MAG: mercury resistance system periplasmic binding protein MerP [Steroidobacteraceae bacterium]
MKLLAAVLSATLIFCQCTSAYAATRTTTLVVPGMTCVTCPITVKKVLSRVDGVSDVSVSFEKKQAVVTFDDSKTTVKALSQATADVGYPSKAIDETSK